MKNISILGSTGSIGRNTLDVIARNPARFTVTALAAGRDLSLLKRQIDTFRPEIVSVIDDEHGDKLRDMLENPAVPKIVSGDNGYREVASWGKTDMVVSAISGAAGLSPTIEAIDAGKDIALANKETMVMAGELVIDRAAGRGVNIVPVDSEHNAIFQCLKGHNKNEVKKLVLTASGGPFLTLPIERFAHITLEDALRHPNWEMGRKITIDSASMMNKVLEIIEARWLFGIDVDRIDVCVHPQSIVHSMVEYIDGSVIAQLGVPDMRGPISYALSYPERLPGVVETLDLCSVGKLEFIAPDPNRFPVLELAYAAAENGGSAPAVLNASNEVAVEAFIEGKVRFVDIVPIVKDVLASHRTQELVCVEDILDADRWGRARTKEVIKKIGEVA
ncbi:MAG: 1-deoxy-D-xylulose-5-phosphate reductoisomerase [Thermodesulfobacteriota bacterium]|nr:1-deoxy-D-xylulose-5-phosphate reductoisomerase [Thermodesulfobacteriota bacterium]